LIDNKIAEKARWREIAQGVGSSFSVGDKVQTSGNQQKMADAVCHCITLEEEINAEIDKLIDKRREVVATIEELDVDEYELLHNIYVKYMPIQDAADAMEKSYSWATTIHGRALAHVAEILNKREGKVSCTKSPTKVQESSQQPSFVLSYENTSKP
jgi:membrane-associated HD superfamily phosphohydrolase